MVGKVCLDLASVVSIMALALATFNMLLIVFQRRQPPK